MIPHIILFQLRKHALSNILKKLQPKKEKFRLKNSDIFHISAQNIACEYSLEQILYTHVNPRFTLLYKSGV